MINNNFSFARIFNNLNVKIDSNSTLFFTYKDYSIRLKLPTTKKHNILYVSLKSPLTNLLSPFANKKEHLEPIEITVFDRITRKSILFYGTNNDSLCYILIQILNKIIKCYDYKKIYIIGVYESANTAILLASMMNNFNYIAQYPIFDEKRYYDILRKYSKNLSSEEKTKFDPFFRNSIIDNIELNFNSSKNNNNYILLNSSELHKLYRALSTDINVRSLYQLYNNTYLIANNDVSVFFKNCYDVSFFHNLLTSQTNPIYIISSLIDIESKKLVQVHSYIKELFTKEVVNYTHHNSRFILYKNNDKNYIFLYNKEIGTKIRFYLNFQKERIYVGFINESNNLSFLDQEKFYDVFNIFLSLTKNDEFTLHTNFVKSECKVDFNLCISDITDLVFALKASTFILNSLLNNFSTYFDN